MEQRLATFEVGTLALALFKPSGLLGYEVGYLRRFEIL
jgi:hypothetical protein